MTNLQISKTLDPMNREVIEDYLLDLNEKGKSSKTIETYKKVLEKLLLFCDKPVKDVIPKDVFEFLHMNYGEKKATTYCRNYWIIKSFTTFCQVEGYTDRVLIKKRWRYKVPESLPKSLTKNEQAQLKIKAEELSVRDRAIKELLKSSGCRRKELLNLNIEDVDLEDRVANVIGKGNKPREVEFSEECSFLLKKYLKTRQDDNPALFISRLGRRLSESRLYKIIKQLGESAGFKDRITPHIFRHTYATNEYSKGNQLSKIGRKMGHANLRATTIYAHIPTDELSSDYNKKMGGI
ncbi:tyrosine-type recombinase/integrase [Natranaerobius trueperi]|uniref:Integrase n=1 Tax=Natranaerobius trueperi TaxID=759412 RepID=A0A226BZ53_9FIRM|nr:tyrosine-type recombinase/integrase [Natranaerobius trueperi]OWZ83387.1 integrase [Natranaerobius trueperi]